MPYADALITVADATTVTYQPKCMQSCMGYHQHAAAVLRSASLLTPNQA